MGAAQKAVLGQLVYVAANGLWGNGEGLSQLIDADVATVAGEVEDVVLAGSEIH